MPNHKVFVFGIDGGTWDVILPALEKGKLPNLQSLIESGFSGPLCSTIHPITPMAWSSFATGMNAGKHGIFDFSRRQGEQLVLNTARDRRAPAIWTYLSELNKPSIVLNVPFTYPPERIKGIMIPGFDAPVVGREIFHPEGVYDELDYGTHHVRNVKFKDWIQWEKTAICAHRGEFSLGPTTLHTGDPFGLFSVTLEYPSSLDLIVLPPTLPLPAMDIAPGGRAGEGVVRTNTIEHSVTAASVREYNPGDSLRWVHWPTSARRGSLFVRLFDATLSSDWWIVLDMDQAVHFGEDLNATEEYAVVLAASLANQGLRAGQAVGLVSHDENLVWHPPQPGEGQRWEIMHTLASISLGARPLSDLLNGIGQSIGHHTSLVLITPSPNQEWTEALLQLTRQGVIPTVIFLDPETFGLGIDIKPVRKTLIDQGIRHYVVAREALNFFDPRTTLLEESEATYLPKNPA